MGMSGFERPLLLSLPHQFPHPALATPGYALPMARHKSFRSQLYRAARDLGNVQAAEKGPGSYAKRVARRKVYRSTNGLTRKVLRGFGL
jgi:hypothetical protein